MNNTKRTLAFILTGIVVFTAGRFSKPTKVETKTVTKIETVKVEGKTRVVYRDRVISPDGTIREKEVEREETNTREESNSVASSEKTVQNDVGLVLSALAITDTKDIHKDKEYAITASKRIIGALNVSAIITSERKVGVGIGWSF